MIVTQESLRRLDQHWAVASLSSRVRQRGTTVASLRHVREHIGRQLEIQFSEKADDTDKLGNLAMAYELAAVEGLDALLHPTQDSANVELQQQAMAGAFRAFEIRRSLPIPSDDDYRVFHILHLAALAYCGDRWTDLRRWLHEHQPITTSPSVAKVDWDRRVTYRLFECWIRLLRKDRWDDLDGVREIIAGLREDQNAYEAGVLKKESDAATHAMAFRLVALYHWAKATEILARYMLQGEPTAVATQLDQHFERSRDAAQASRDPSLEVLTRWLHVAARRMVEGSIWWVAQTVNSRATRFVSQVTKARALFELLPPQRAALQEHGLLDPSSRAVIVDLPTSGGKTTLAQFRILQALNQFDADQGWVAYVAPTKALTSQITRRLREDFEPLQINVEQLTAAVEIDGFEERLLATTDANSSFHVLVATPEKLDLVIRNKKISRPLALIVMDEAHNIEDEERGLRIELLLATIKRDCPNANFLLMMPNVPNASDLATWLGSGKGRTVSLATSAWQPNERIVGTYSIQRETPRSREWNVTFESLTTTPKTIHLEGNHQVGSGRLLPISYTKAKSLTKLTGAMAKNFSERGTSIGVARTIPDAWTMARTIADDLQPLDPLPEEVGLVQRFLATEISPQFELIDMLQKGVGVHHAGLSDDARSLIEWLAETSHLRVLCATATITQGINFPVSSVFLASIYVPHGRMSTRMNTRSFWNLAGRAGRIKQDSVGVVGIAGGENATEIRGFVSEATEDLISRLVTLLDEVEQLGQLANLSLVIEEEQWADFRSYVAHLWNDKKNLDAVLAETEQLLRNTFGYSALQSKGGEGQRRKAKALLDATKDYAKKIASNPGSALLADATGFAPDGVASALAAMTGLPRKLTATDWEPKSLFGPMNKSMLPHLVGVMMRIPQIKKSLIDLAGIGPDQRRIAEVAQAWVSGMSVEQIAKHYFTDPSEPTVTTDAITSACRAIYRNLASAGTWGLSALSKLGPSGLDFEKMQPEMKRAINNLPAMLYHGVTSEEAVLMRMNSVPRTVAERLGQQFADNVTPDTQNVRVARTFLRSLQDADWQRVAPKNATMSGADYRTIWMRLAGESTATALPKAESQ